MPKDSTSGGTTSQNTAKYQRYLNETKDRTSLLSEEKKSKRAEFTAKLSATKTYGELVTNKVVSTDYLLALSTIANGVVNINKDGFTVSSHLMEALQKSSDGEDKINFVVAGVALTQPQMGGMPVELIEVFDRYRGKYKLFGDEGKTIVNANDGKAETIPVDYDLAPVFIVLNPDDKEALDALAEARIDGISIWNQESTKEPIEYIYPHIATARAYNAHLKKVYPSSKYFIDIDYDMTAVQLFKTYEENEIAADEKFKGKKIAVSGKIYDLSKDIMGNPVVSLEVDILQTVNCYFSEKEMSALSKLKKGQQIKIVGTCDGMMLWVGVALKKCKIL